MLTETQVAQAEARLRPYKLADSSGLYLFVYSSGSKAWRYDYVLDGRKETLTIGLYPEISLARARELHAEARGLVARGESPARAKAGIRRAEREAARAAKETRTREWASRFKPPTQIAAFAGKKLSEITASEGIFFANAIAGAFADALADRVISRLERSSAVARAPAPSEGEK
jgi:Arm DNA-binding domain